MYTTRRLNLKHVLPRSNFLTFLHLVPVVVVYVLYVLLDLHGLAIPMAPITIVGTAVAFYVGFKNNSSYDRLWEGRRLWGSITNASRTWAAMVVDLIKDNNNEDLQLLAKHMILRQVAWCNALRLQLRRSKVWSEKYYQTYTAGIQRKWNYDYLEVMKETLDKFCGEKERNFLMEKQNIATHLLHLQSKDIKALKNRGVIDQWEHTNLTNVITDLYNQQGGCERIKGYPFPRQYAVFSRVFVDIFICILPFGLMPEIARITPNQQWLIFPICIVVSWVFNAMEQVGDLSENPFENALTDIPMSAMCRNIEIDLRQMMGDTEVPERLTPVDGILM